MPMPQALQPLLDLLAAQQPKEQTEFDQWQIRPIRGGANNLVYRASRGAEDLAIKFMVRDSRQRAQREFLALTALHQSGLEIAPIPWLLEEVRYAQPVVVQSWLNGDVIDAPPATDADWQRLIEQHALIHRVAAEEAVLPLRAVISPNSFASCQDFIRMQLRHIPPAKQTAELQELVRRFELWPMAEWPTPPAMLCHDDANITNFVRRPGPWATVDWENSGWGDSAFEIADLISHPAYLDVKPSKWPWVIQTYCEMVGQPDAERRIHVYYGMMLVWWVARLERYLHEIPAGLDVRLVERPANWQENVLAKRTHYVALAFEWESYV